MNDSADLEQQRQAHAEHHRNHHLADARAIVRGANVVLPLGHYLYPSGTHGRVWVNALELVTDPTRSWRILQGLLNTIPDSIKNSAGIFAGPVTGGALLAKEAAALVNGSRELKAASSKAIFLDPYPQGGIKPVRKFFEPIIKNQNVVLIDDTRRSGDTLASCAKKISEAGGTVTAILLIMDVETEKSLLPIGVPVYSVQTYHPGLEYVPSKCPMCHSGNLEERKLTRF